jgi:hypothetical protein
MGYQQEVLGLTHNGGGGVQLPVGSFLQTLQETRSGLGLQVSMMNVYFSRSIQTGSYKQAHNIMARSVCFSLCLTPPAGLHCRLAWQSTWTTSRSWNALQPS